MNDMITFRYCVKISDASFPTSTPKKSLFKNFIESDMQRMIDVNIVLKRCLLFGESFKYWDRLWLWVANSNEHWEYFKLKLIKDSKGFIERLDLVHISDYSGDDD